MGAGIGGSALRVQLFVNGSEWAPRVLPDSSLEWIVPVRAGARIEAQRTSLNIFKQYCPYDPPGEPCHPPLLAYDLRPVGLAGVQVEGVVPLQVLPPGAAAGDTALGAPGREATFTIQAVDGMTALVWYFFAWEGSLTQLRDCSGQMSCTIIPPKRGSVIVYGKWNGYTFGSEYLHIKTVPAELQLTCSRYTVTFGDNLTCSAASTSGTLDSLRWEFADARGHMIRDSMRTRWAGRMVISGRLTVRARLNGAVAADDTTITVRPRRWPRPSVVAHEEPATDLPAPENVTRPGHLADSHVDDAASPPVTGIRIDEGPNAGWWYVANPIQDIRVTVHINEAAFQAGSAWYNLQTGGTWTDPKTGIRHPNGYCRRAQVPELRRLTREHEGSVTSPVMSHVRAMQVYIANNAPQDSMANLIAWDDDLKEFTFAEMIASHYRSYMVGNLTGYSAPHTTDSIPGVVPPAIFPCAPRPWY